MPGPRSSTLSDGDPRWARSAGVLGLAALLLWPGWSADGGRRGPGGSRSGSRRHGAVCSSSPRGLRGAARRDQQQLQLTIRGPRPDRATRFVGRSPRMGAGPVDDRIDQDPSPRLRGAQGTRAKPSRRVTSPTSTPAERKARLEELGLPGFRARQLSTHYFSAARRRPRPDDRPAGRAARGAGRRAAARADDAAADARGRQRHHPQDAVEALRRCAGRVGADALPRPGHDVCLQPGRLRHGVPVLRHRPGRAAAQHVHRRDRRAGGRRRPGAGARRGARRVPAASPTWCSWAWASRWPTTRP